MEGKELEITQEKTKANVEKTSSVDRFGCLQARHTTIPWQSEKHSQSTGLRPRTLYAENGNGVSQYHYQ